MACYKDLKVWQLGMEIAEKVYQLTSNFPQQEIYGLTSQMRRSAISIASNIAEGHARFSTKELIRFVGIAQGSLAELETQLLLSSRIGYGNPNQIESILEMANEESRMLNGLRKSLNKKLET